MMRKSSLLKFPVLLLVVLVATTANAQDINAEPYYVAVDCMKSTSVNYPVVETETWQAMHQHLVNKGVRSHWAFYRVMYGDRSRCDYYTVTTYAGVGQLNAEIDYPELVRAAHPGKDPQKALNDTLASRQHVATELWVLVERTDIKAHRYAVVNKMYAPDPVAYETMESRVFKSGHEVLIESGDRAGWAVYSLLSPRGSAIPYNYGTVDYLNALGPVPMAEAMMAGNPDRDLAEMHQLLKLRDEILSETWELLATTSAPPTE